ncbi:MAG: LysR family transcriptional regulator [Blautia sp.]|nr:LysR family transcriptional regulator [Blautia sp.]MDY4516981.1 LysR family transcriptional regulator [Lachnospiraceae bacterium]
MEQHLSQYKIFYTVAQEGNISRAASCLYISQPAISKAIQKLEASLGVTLFFRNSRGVQLTEEGQLLYHYVKAAFDSLDAGEEQIRHMSEPGMGRLRIGVSTTLCKYVLLPYLQRFIQQFPNIRISIQCQSSNHTIQLLQDREIDIGLIGKPASVKNLCFYPLGEIEDIFAASGSYLKNHSLLMDEIADASIPNPASVFHSSTLMLLDKENMTRQYIDDYFKEQKIEPGNLLEISTMDLLIEFAKIGLGVACVIRQFVQKELEDGTLLEIPLQIPIHKREIGFACRESCHRSHALNAFIDFSFSVKDSIL